jgi:hypothetical protein
MSLSQVVSATEVGAGAADGELAGGDAGAAGSALPRYFEGFVCRCHRTRLARARITQPTPPLWMLFPG